MRNRRSMNGDEHGLRRRGVYRPTIPFAHSSRITLVFYQRRAFEEEVWMGVMLWRAFDKTV